MADEEKKLTFGEFYKQNCSSIPEENKEEWEIVNEFYSGQLQKCNDEKSEYLAGWQRAQADFANYKKDERKHFDDAVKYGIEGIIRDMIGVLDSFDLALRINGKQLFDAKPDSRAEGIEKGIRLIRSQMENLLKQRGVEKIPITSGDPFDPAVMEAMAEVESEQPPGAVAEEIEAGYRLYDKIIRAARVAVSKGKEDKT